MVFARCPVCRRTIAVTRLKVAGQRGKHPGLRSHRVLTTAEVHAASQLGKPFSDVEVAERCRGSRHLVDEDETFSERARGPVAPSAAPPGPPPGS